MEPCWVRGGSMEVCIASFIKYLYLVDGITLNVKVLMHLLQLFVHVIDLWCSGVRGDGGWGRWVGGGGLVA